MRRFSCFHALRGSCKAEFSTEDESGAFSCTEDEFKGKKQAADATLLLLQPLSPSSSLPEVRGSHAQMPAPQTAFCTRLPRHKRCFAMCAKAKGGRGGRVLRFSLLLASACPSPPFFSRSRSASAACNAFSEGTKAVILRLLFSARGRRERRNICCQRYYVKSSSESIRALFAVRHHATGERQKIAFFLLPKENTEGRSSEKVSEAEPAACVRPLQGSVAAH